jgi:hypothetical protein
MTLLNTAAIDSILDRWKVSPGVRSYSDSTYSVIDKPWFLSVFSEAFTKMLAAFNLLDYVPQRNDCDKYARGCQWFLGMLFNLTPNAPQTGTAIGLFWYSRDVGEDSHAINILIHNNDLWFYEPQTRLEVALTPQEVQSCYKCAF